MKFWVLNLDFKNASIDQRVLAIPQNDDFAERVLGEVEQKVVLSTCNRMEIYGAGGAHSPKQILKKWQEHSQFSDEVMNLFEIKTDQAALLHLFRVASSLESMVLGESQIVGQLKEAYENASAKGWCKGLMHQSFQQAMKCSKKVRSETEVGQFAVSVPSIGVKLAEKILGNLATRTVGIAGLGEIGRVAAEHFGSIGPKKLLLFNRTRQVADDFCKKILAENIHAEVVSSMEELASRSEVFVTSIPSPELFREADIQSFDDRGRPLFLLDLAVPRCIPSVSVSKIFIYNVDDLKRIAEENSYLREQELHKAEHIVSQQVQHFSGRLQNMNLGETFSKLQEKIEEIRRDELSDLKQRLGSLELEDWLKVEKMSERLSRRILEDPMLELKNQMKEHKDRDALLSFFRNMFKI